MDSLMDNLEFAKLMIEYERHYRRMQEIEERIKLHVLGLGKTQSVANVTARYSGGRSLYDYERAGKNSPKDVIEKNTKLVKKTDWRKICEEMGLEKDSIPLKSESTPSVTIVVE